MPLISKKRGAFFAICNLQRTPLTDEADLHIFAKTDVVMEKLMEELGHSIPKWTLNRHLKISVTPRAPPSQRESQGKARSYGITIEGVDPEQRSVVVGLVRDVDVHASIVGTKEPACHLRKQGESQRSPGVIQAEVTIPSDSRDTKSSLQGQKIKLTGKVHFFSHYNEPSLALAVVLPLPIGQHPSIAEYHLRFYPMEGKWVVEGVATTRDGITTHPSTMKPMLISARSNSGRASSQTPFPCAWSRAVSLGCKEELPRKQGGGPRSEKQSFHADSKVYQHPSHKRRAPGILIAGSAVRAQQRPNIAYITVNKAEGMACVRATSPHKAAGRWGHSLTPLPACERQTPRALLFGGWDNRSQFNDLLEISINAGKGQQKPDGQRIIDVRDVRTSGESPSHRSCHSMTSIGKGTFLLFGGSACGGGPYRFFNDVHLLEERGGEGDASYQWREVKCKGCLPAPRSQHSAVLCSGEGDQAPMLLVIGGHDGSRLLNDVYSLDLTSYVWRKRHCPKSSDLPEAVAIPQSARKDFRVLPVQTGATVFGKKQEHVLYRCVHGTYVLNTKSWSWSRLAKGTGNPTNLGHVIRDQTSGEISLVMPAGPKGTEHVITQLNLEVASDREEENKSSVNNGRGDNRYGISHAEYCRAR